MDICSSDENPAQSRRFDNDFSDTDKQEKADLPSATTDAMLSVENTEEQQHLHQKSINRRKNYCPKMSSSDQQLDNEQSTNENDDIDVVGGVESEQHRQLSQNGQLVTSALFAADCAAQQQSTPTVFSQHSLLTFPEIASSPSAEKFGSQQASFHLPIVASAAELLLQQQQQQQQQRALWQLQALLLSQQSPALLGQAQHVMDGAENSALLALSKQLAAIQRQQQHSTLHTNTDDDSRQPTTKKQKSNVSNSLSPSTVPSSLNDINSHALSLPNCLSVNHTMPMNGDIGFRAGDAVMSPSFGSQLLLDTNLPNRSSSSVMSSSALLLTGRNKSDRHIQGPDSTGESSATSSAAATFNNADRHAVITESATNGYNQLKAATSVNGSPNIIDATTNSSSAADDEEDMLFIDDDDDDDEERGEDDDLLSNSNNSGNNTGAANGGEKQWQGVRQSVRYLDVWKYVYRCRGKHEDDQKCAFPPATAESGSSSGGGREHFHCLFCKDKQMHRKEEMIRHVKNHKKRDETLQLGFMRYTNAENCAVKFPHVSCQYREKQTHYHCLGAYCTKIYTSTSDVQMHASLHKKEQQMQREGFQRFKATGGARCDKPGCPFKDEKVTHFHCIREGCQLDAFGFKNKADLTKHKAYHDKNDQLQKQGFIKYMKHDHCPFEQCPYSKVFNHIHCLRPGCQEVFTSAAQTTTHKRKHERTATDQPSGNTNSDGSTSSERNLTAESFSSELPQKARRLKSTSSASMLLAVAESDHLVKSTNSSPLMTASANAICAVQSLLSRRLMVQQKQQQQQQAVDGKNFTDSGNASECFSERKIKKFSISSAASLSTSPTTADVLSAAVQRSVSMTTSPIPLPLSSTLGDKKTSRRKRKQGVGEGGLVSSSAVQCREWSVARTSSPLLSADISGGGGGECSMEINTTNSTALNGNNKRKRGRPPKSAAITINKRGSGPHMPPTANPQAIFTNFKLGKGGRLVNMKSELAAYADGKPVHVTAMNAAPATAAATFAGRGTSPASSGAGAVVPTDEGENNDDQQKSSQTISAASSIITPPNSGSPRTSSALGHPSDSFSCSTNLSATLAAQLPLSSNCRYQNRCRLFTWQHPHYHCARERCHFGTDALDIFLGHIQQFHADQHQDLLVSPTFEYFDSLIECEYEDCQSKGVARHFHCLRTGCGFSCARHSTMETHEERQHAVASQRFAHAEPNNSRKSHSSAGSVQHVSSSPQVLHSSTTALEHQGSQSWTSTNLLRNQSHESTTTAASSLATIAALFQQQQQQNRSLSFATPIDEFNGNSSAAFCNALAGAVLSPSSQTAPPPPPHQPVANPQTLILDALLKLIRTPSITSDPSKLSFLLNLYKTATASSLPNNNSLAGNTSFFNNDPLVNLILVVQQQQQLQQANSTAAAAAAQILSLSQSSSNVFWPQQQSTSTQQPQSQLNNLLFPGQSLSLLPFSSSSSSSSSSESLNMLLAKLAQSSANPMPSLLNNYQSMLSHSTQIHPSTSVQGNDHALTSMLALANGQSQHFHHTANNPFNAAATSTAGPLSHNKSSNKSSTNGKFDMTEKSLE